MGWLEEEVIPYFRKPEAELATRDLLRQQAFGEAFAAMGLENITRYETHLDRKLERTPAMLPKLKELRQEAGAA